MGPASAYSTAALIVTENKAEPWRGGLTRSLLSPSGKSLNYLAIREIWPTWQMGRSNTCAWPEVEDEIDCHHAEQGWGSRGPQGGSREGCRGASQAGLTEFQKPEPGGGSHK